MEATADRPLGLVSHRPSVIAVDFCPKPESDESHEEPMTKVEEAEMRESIHALLLSNTSLNRALNQRVEQPAVAVAKEKPWWLSPLLTIVGAIIVVFGIKYVPAAQSDSDKQIYGLQLKLEQKEKHEQYLEREVRLAQQYNRDLHIWFADHGMKGVPAPPSSSREE